jgi:hypothetical protein
MIRGCRRPFAAEERHAGTGIGTPRVRGADGNDIAALGDPASWDEPAGDGRGQPLGDFRIAGHPHQLVKLLGRGQQVEAAFAPQHDQMRRQRRAGEQRADEDVGVNDQSHASAGFAGMGLARRRNGLVEQRIQRLGR